MISKRTAVIFLKLHYVSIVPPAVHDDSLIIVDVL